MAIQPWLRETVSLKSPPEVMQVNDVRVHSSSTENALVIPPESRIQKGTVVARLYTSTQKRRLLECCKTELQRKSALRTIAGEFRCEQAEIEAAWNDIQSGYPLYGQEFHLTPGQLLQDEYQALIKIIPDLAEDEDFVTEHLSSFWKQLADEYLNVKKVHTVCFAIDRLIAVKRLKEIMVFKGFRRADGSDGPTVVPPDIDGKSDWLPAIELFGEGIFITLDVDRLEQWEQMPAVQARASSLQKRFETASFIINKYLIKVTPRFLLLHAFSHLLIRQLECDGGYPAASLKERIYCSTSDLQMAGILIYVAVPDIVGSLGGIIEIAEPQRFLALAMAALKRARWCSLDPVCAEHEGQGMHLLNRAACHACLLVPETSCDYQNLLLDRIMVKGDPLHGIPSFFESA